MRKRPWPLSILSLFLLLIGLFHIYTAIQIIRNKFLIDLISNNLLPIYLFCKAVLWGIWGTLQSWAVWRGKGWGKNTSITFSLTYTLLFWIDQIWIAESQALVDRWLVNLILTIIGLSGLIFIINQKSSRSFFS